MATGPAPAPEQVAAPPDSRETVGNITTFVSGMTKFHNNPDLSDIVLRVGPNVYYAHKFALARSSDVFHTMLAGQLWEDSKKSEIVLKESSACEEVFGEFLKYFYCGQVTLEIDTAVPLLLLGDKYNVESIRTECEKFMRRKVQGGNARAAVMYMHYARMYGFEELEEKCFDAISRKFESAVAMPEWLELDVQYVGELLQCTTLIVENEFAVFKAMQDWVLAEYREAQAGENLIRLLPHVRFSQMLPQQLVNVERSVIGQKFPLLLSPFINEAYRFRSLAGQVGGFHDNKFLPRDYTAKEWCTFLRLQLSDIRRFQHNVRTISLDSPVPNEVNLSLVLNTIHTHRQIWLSKMMNIIHTQANMPVRGAEHHRPYTDYMWNIAFQLNYIGKRFRSGLGSNATLHKYECLAIKLTPLKICPRDRSFEISLLVYDRDVNVAQIIRRSATVKATQATHRESYAIQAATGFRFGMPSFGQQDSVTVEQFFEENELGPDSAYVKEGAINVAVIIKPHVE
ncbi:BTB/POZ domain-containing protein 17 [Branchiostoma belcheri]|nr:BTB/POZ domain-containing protein 17 [Branchiostoma belcheri]